LLSAQKYPIKSIFDTTKSGGKKNIKKNGNFFIKKVGFLKPHLILLEIQS
jgi:hypothetical protein